MMKKQDCFKRIIKIFQDLRDSYPTQSIGQHITLATLEYPNLLGITDKELLEALERYQSNLELDMEIDYDRYLYSELNEEDDYEQI